MQFTRESIFVSAVRSFCTCFGAILGILIGLILVVVTVMMFSSPDILPQKSDLSVAANAKGERNLLPHSAPVVLKINIQGTIGQGDLTGDKFQNILFDSRDGLLQHDRVKAILLNMDTPGGTVTDADAIYRSLMAYKQQYKVPIYAYVDGMCASGGMYIACAADKIYASKVSVIGSVGVILGPTFNFSQLMERYGVQALTLTEGKDKDMLNPFRPWQPGEEASLRSVTALLYQDFVDLVVGARPNLDRQKLINEYGAQVYLSSVAQKYGYVDVADADYNLAMSDLAKTAGITEDQDYQVFQIQPTHPFFSDLAGVKSTILSGKVDHVFQIGPYMNSELSGRFLYLYQPAVEVK